MINEQINKLREFAAWARTTLGKAANIDISIWCHRSDTDESIEYRIWVDDLIQKSSKNLDELVDMIPKFKIFCELSMEVAA